MASSRARPRTTFTHIASEFVWIAQALTTAYIPSLAKMPAIEAATLSACDARADGVKDGVLDGIPRQCWEFDPAVLLCKGAESGRVPHSGAD